MITIQYLVHLRWPNSALGSCSWSHSHAWKHWTSHTESNVVAEVPASARVHTATEVLSLSKVPERDGHVKLIAAENSPRNTELVPAIIHGGYRATSMSIREVFENMHPCIASHPLMSLARHKVVGWVKCLSFKGFSEFMHQEWGIWRRPVWMGCLKSRQKLKKYANRPIWQKQIKNCSSPP